MEKIREKKREKKLRKMEQDDSDDDDEPAQTKANTPETKDANRIITLFVRNIGFETTEEKFKEFMQKFGEINYAVLCKQHNMGQEDQDGEAVGPSHRGTGFVQFKNTESAIQLLELSQKVEQHLDTERRNFRLK